MAVSGIQGICSTFKVEQIAGVQDTGEMQNASVRDTGEVGIVGVTDTGKLIFDSFLFFTNLKPLILTLKQQPIKKDKI